MKFRLQRFDRVQVASGFYAGYSGCVLDKRWFVMYAINVGGQPTYIPRWHLRFMGYKRPDFHKKIRDKMIANDKKRSVS
jgi:hypothetical protein